MTDILKFHHVNIEKCYNLWYTKNVPKFSNYYKKNLFYLSAAMCTNKVSEFNKLINSLEVSDEVKKIMKEMSREMIVNFYKENVPVDTIAKCANVSREKVLRIVKAV